MTLALPYRYLVIFYCVFYLITCVCDLQVFCLDCLWSLFILLSDYYKYFFFLFQTLSSFLLFSVTMFCYYSF